MNFKNIFLILLLVSFVNAAPIWFDKLPYKGYEIIGYGTGSSYEEAIAQAKADVANNIKLEIKSELKINTKESNDDVSHIAQSSIKSVSNVILAGVEVIKREQVKDKYFVAVKYDTRPFEVRFFEKVSENKRCTNKSTFLNKTPFGENLKKLASCDLDLKLYKNNNIFFIENNGISMAWSEDNIDALFVEQQNVDLNLNPSKANLKHNEAFYLSLKSNKMGGYVSFFNLYNQGEVVLMVDNIPNNFGKTIKIPQFLDENLELVASTNGEDDTKDLYIVIWHKDKLQFPTFDIISDKTVDNSSNDNFSKLIDILDKNIWSSALVRVKK
ncbi:hypothetical protein AAX27_01226 [Aliarcobacter thereius]|nr:hypothetical protein AAX27_01226 [Aliarcobacter thereius]